MTPEQVLILLADVHTIKVAVYIILFCLGFCIPIAITGILLRSRSD